MRLCDVADPIKSDVMVGKPVHEVIAVLDDYFCIAVVGDVIAYRSSSKREPMLSLVLALVCEVIV